MSRGTEKEEARIRNEYRQKEYGEACYHKGLKCGDAGDFKSTVRFLNEALKYDPLNHTYLTIRAMAKCQTEDFKGAVEDYDKVIELYPGNKEAYLYRSRAKDLLGDQDGAESDRVRARLVIK